MVTPATLTLSNSVCPSTSKSPFKSVEPATVTIPVAFMLRMVKSGPIIPGPPGAVTRLLTYYLLKCLLLAPKSTEVPFVSGNI